MPECLTLKERRAVRFHRGLASHQPADPAQPNGVGWRDRLYRGKLFRKGRTCTATAPRPSKALYMYCALNYVVIGARRVLAFQMPYLSTRRGITVKAFAPN
eukprot:586908-Amphidinium_carterae.1